MTYNKLRKATATPEQWAQYLEYHRRRRLGDLANEQARKRAYQALDHVRAARRAYDNRPEQVAKRRERGRTPEAKARAKERQKERLEEDPDLRVRRNAWSRKYNTGFSPELVADLLVQQDNKCAICRESFDNRKMHADHCHDTKRPRGLLCRHCNVIDGMLASIGIDPVDFAHGLVSYRCKPPAENNLARQPSLRY